MCLSTAKALKFKGEVAIQSCTNTETTGESLLVKDNMLLFVMNGSFRIRYGKDASTIKKNQMVLLKKDILIEYATTSQSDDHDNPKFIMTYFKNDLLKEFVKLSQLSVQPPKNPKAVTIDSIDTRLLKFMESLESYFLEPENIDEYLTKIKLLELLFNLNQVDSNILPQLMNLQPHYRTDITTTVENNVMSPMSLTKLAMLAGRSMMQASRETFSQFTTCRHQRG